MNEAMVRRYAPMYAGGLTPIGNPGDAGTGILMGMGAGGGVVNMHECFVTVPFYPPSSLTHGVFVNDKGQRFINEDAYHGRVGHAALLQQRQVSRRVYLVADADAYGDYETASYLQAPVAGTGETMQELEEELGLPAGSLVETLLRYNRDAEAGEDQLFHKSPNWLRPLRPPFVALDCSLGQGTFYPFFTLGGLDTLPTGEVLTAERKPIRGLNQRSGEPPPRPKPGIFASALLGIIQSALTRGLNIRESVIVALRDAADPVRAPQQQAYMKSDMPYLGVGVPQCRRIACALFAKHPLLDADAWEAAILDLWRRAAHREERYAAVELLLFRRYSSWLEPARLPMIEEMVVTGAWWDYVDAIAGRGVGAMLAAHPYPMKAILREWARDGDVWKRRTAILAQLRAKQGTDPNLLADSIRPSIGHPEFFLRKGIGWALREYSKTDPGWVTAFVDAHPGLSTLSRREALKHLERQRQRRSEAGSSD